MKQKSRKYLGFTLIELMTVTVILGLIMPCIVAVYAFMIKSNREFSLRQTAIQQGYEFFERLNLLMQDYTIDYEEYFNRQMVGCGGGTGSNFTWNVGLSGYCTEFTAYGNQNSTKRNMELGQKTIPETYHDIYECSSEISYDGRESLPRVVREDKCGKIGSKQSFGQYKTLFINVKGIGETADDEDLGIPMPNDYNCTNCTEINAIMDANNIKELYLISHDGKKRLYFRRKMFPQDGGSVQYKIQMLRLRGFDAGQKHDFSVGGNEGLYDGQIDTWACDTSMGFVGNGSGVGGAYAGYYLPRDVDDCWVDLTYGNTSIYAWNLSISPLNDSDLYWKDGERQINPYMKILVVNSIYSPLAYSGTTISEFKIPIETTINMKDFYKE